MRALNIDDRAPDSLVSPPRVARLIESLARCAASADNLDPTRDTPHSIRSVGASALFVAGVRSGFIRLFGRWASLLLRDYLWRDYVLPESYPRRPSSQMGLCPT